MHIFGVSRVIVRRCRCIETFTMDVVYALEPFPSGVSKTIFLAGPTPRKGVSGSWRLEAIQYLHDIEFNGTVFVPEPRHGDWAEHYDHQVEWEEEALNRADRIIFWVPRDIKGPNGGELPGFTTNIEWGVWCTSGKVALGAPALTEKMRYLDHYANKLRVSRFDNLRALLNDAVMTLGQGAKRDGWECLIPLQIWQRREFTSWHKRLTQAGHQIISARVIWTHFTRPDKLFAYAIQTTVQIAGEGRVSTPEFVVFRPDITSVVMFSHTEWGEPEVVLVREFRNAVRNSAGFIYELPGGSGPSEDTLQTAVEEVEEETGVRISPDRFIAVQSRQLAATFSGHKATLYSVELTPEEMSRFKRDKSAHGLEKDNERTYVEVFPLTRIISSGLVDWTTLGMICSVVST